MLTIARLLLVMLLLSLPLKNARLQERLEGDFERIAPAELWRVDQGLFALSVGQSIDVSDRHLLLTLREGRRCLEIWMNGRDACVETGAHFDLTWEHAPFHLDDLFADKERCFLDVVSVDQAKGAETSVTFRFYCA